MNFSFHPLAERYKQDDWKFGWEMDYVANSDSNIFRNMQEAAETLAAHDIQFEHECYDVGHLNDLKFCIDIGLCKASISSSSSWEFWALSGLIWRIWF